MFERYTEAARKGVFFARYEASQFGSQYIETEHLLLGILRTDGLLALRLLKAREKIESIREQIEKQSSRREKIAISVDLPLSAECKRVLAYGAEEAERLQHKHIAPEHLLLGLLREEKSVASKMMLETASPLLDWSKRRSSYLQPARRSPGRRMPLDFVHRWRGPRELRAAARNGALSPLIGREHELERTIQILARRTKNNRS
jgi:ATP-dependent Clp protease ATP-binding subunit ClpC